MHAWEYSLKLSKSYWSLRHLALISRRADFKEREMDLLAQAWESGPKLWELAVEYTRVLSELGDYIALQDVVAMLPEKIRLNERILLYSAKAALKAGDFKAVEPLFEHFFVSIREGETSLSDIWFEYHERRISAAQGIPQNEALRARVRKEYPPPKTIDFRLND